MSYALHPAQNAARTQRDLPTMARLMVASAVLVTAWNSRRQTRKTLAVLSDHELKDVGLSRDLAIREAAKPFWRS